jgi:Fe2+ or Zn2+ uptake regulation protein
MKSKMVSENRGNKMSIKLTEHQQQLISALKSQGDWMRLDDLARAIGKAHLSPEDVMTLDELESSGMLVKEISDNLSPEGQTVRYRYSIPKTAPLGR